MTIFKSQRIKITNQNKKLLQNLIKYIYHLEKLLLQK